VDAAAGMSFLSERHTIHRDLALRNLLVAPKQEEGGVKYVVKVAGQLQKSHSS
jgi:hypothetical protein